MRPGGRDKVASEAGGEAILLLRLGFLNSSISKRDIRLGFWSPGKSSIDLLSLMDSFVSSAIERLRNLLEDHVVKVIGVNSELEELQTTIVKVQETLRQYEGCEVQNEQGLILLSRLNEAMYDAEDILQDCRLHAEKRRRTESGCHERVRLPSFSLRNVYPDLAFRREVGDKIREIKAEIETVLPEIMQFSKNPAAEQGQGSSARVMDFYPGIVSNDIIGLGDEIADLLNALTFQTDLKIEDNVHVITGMPGIGKTSLAKMLFNSLEVHSHFKKRIWLCVTKQCQFSDLLKSIVEQIDDASYDERFTTAYLLHLVERLVRNHRLLVVLDDCWSADVWIRLLRDPFSKAAEGSAVVITTRSRVVIQEMNAREFVKSTLSPEDGKELLRKEIYGSHGKDWSGIEDVIKEFVRKCKGVPLAIKVIGGVLKRKRPRDWSDICSSDLWKNDSLPNYIMPALLLSYMDLPYHLKQCFSHCAFFPENYTFHCPYLVQLWMAEGFVNMESTGTECYKELVARNLLDTEPSYYDGNASKMHPIMHALANYVSSRHFVKLKKSSNTRHLYLVDKDLSEVPDIEHKQASCLRSIILSKNPIKVIPEGYLENFSRLRVLDLRYTGIENLPNSIENLLQLRLINLSFTRLIRLPDSIRNLTNLQSLQLLGSNHLIELPEGVVDLTNLRCLTMGGSNARLDHLPPGIGLLQELRRLDGFLVNTDISNIEDLENLSLLTELTLHKLERVDSPEKAQRAVLHNKAKLTHLHLACSSMRKPSTNNIELVFEKLYPPLKCISIHIDGYFGEAFPRWMTTLPFYDLEWLRLENCMFCKQLPPLGQLPRLKVLDIRKIPLVTKIGSDFTGTLKFPLLEELYFIGLDRVQEWSGFEQGAFPCLKKLEIVTCPKLKHLSSGMNALTSLRELTITETKEIKQIKDIPSVRKLWLRRNQSLMEVSDMAEVDFMRIRRCSSIENITGLMSLRYLILSDHRMIFLPEWLTKMPSVKRLDLEVNKSLFERIYDTKIEFQKFEHIEHVEVRCYTEDRGKPDINQTKNVEGSHNVEKDSNLYVSYKKNPFSITSNLGRERLNNASSSSNLYTAT